MPYFSNDNNFTPVPTAFIKKQLPQANPTFVKVYLYLLMLSSENATAEFADIAETLGLLESDLMLAIKYWESCGVIFKNGDNISFGSGNINPEKNDETKVQEKPRTENLAQIIEADRSLSDMFMVSQEILGKTISERDMETIYWFYSVCNQKFINEIQRLVVKKIDNISVHSFFTVIEQRAACKFQ